MVITPENWFISFEFNKICIVYILHLLDHLVCLEPSTIENYQIFNFFIDFFQRFTILMRIKDISRCRRLRDLIEDLDFVLAYVFACKGIERDVICKKSHWSDWALVYFLGSMMNDMKSQRDFYLLDLEQITFWVTFKTVVFDISFTFTDKFGL